MSLGVELDDRFRLSAAQAAEIAERFGTPCYVVDESHFRARIRRYLAAFKSIYPDSQLTFASKANSTLAVLKIAASEGCLIDVASEGELRAALAAGILASQCHLHGNNKSLAELKFAVEQGVHGIVVDNFEEIETLATLGTLPELVLRLAPGVDPVTHAKISTGQADTKFGFNIADGSGERALVRCLELRLPVVGFHCHVGSQLMGPEAQESGGALLAEFALRMQDKYGFKASVINVGGGLGVRYTDSDNPISVEDYCQRVVGSIKAALGEAGLNPTLLQEPGRSLIAESGVTLYRVGVKKSVPSANGQRHYLVVDGGLSDNPRPVMYGARYTVLATDPKPGATHVFRMSGKHCETDTLFDDIELPEATGPGDLVQVLTTGAYNSAMASNYNRFRRPSTILVRSNGTFEQVQRPESWDEMFARESVPSDL